MVGGGGGRKPEGRSSPSKDPRLATFWGEKFKKKIEGLGGFTGAALPKKMFSLNCAYAGSLSQNSNQG